MRESAVTEFEGWFSGEKTELDIAKLNLKHRFSEEFMSMSLTSEEALALIPPHSSEEIKAVGDSFFIGDVARYGEPKLGRENATALFRAMNYLLWQADKLRASLLDSAEGPETLARKEQVFLLHRAALRIQEYLFRANLPLLVGAMKKFPRPDEHWDDLGNAGMWLLLNAIRYFDYSRESLFSTYFYNIYSQTINGELARAKVQDPTASSNVTHKAISIKDLEERRMTSAELIEEAEFLNLLPFQIETLLKQTDLSTREREVIIHLFGLEGHEAETATKLSERLGISRGVVTNYKARAIRKLREAWLKRTRGTTSQVE